MGMIMIVHSRCYSTGHRGGSIYVVRILEVEELAIQCPNCDKYHNHYKTEVT